MYLKNYKVTKGNEFGPENGFYEGILMVLVLDWETEDLKEQRLFMNVAQCVDSI